MNNAVSNPNRSFQGNDLRIPNMPPCPEPGEGVHAWLMPAGWACRKAGLSADVAAQELENRMTRCPNSPNEIQDAIRKVYETKPIIWHSRRNLRPTFKWPTANIEQIDALTSSGLSMKDLWDASPIHHDDDRPRTAEILTKLFPGNPLLCAGSKYNFFTDTLSSFLERADTLELIVPSPMLSKFGRTIDGKLSQHTLEATGPRRFLIVEGDKINGVNIPKDTQASVLLHLAKLEPLTLVVDSGGKSLHGWFFVGGKTDEQLVPFFSRACTLGADHRLWVRSQFVRMPDGTRENGNRQQILFFNPETISQ